MRRLCLRDSLCLPVLVLIAVSSGACQSSPPSTGAASPAPIGLGLPPAQQTVPPPAAELPPELPSFIPPPPSGVPPPPPTIEYTSAAANLAAFVTAYREAFTAPELPEGDVAQAGARLCTYLQRHVEGGSSVNLDRAVNEADVNEPGYPRAIWVTAFEIAQRFYCPEFVIDVGGQTP